MSCTRANWQPDFAAIARRLIRESRERAPSFIFLNHCFEESLKLETDDEDERKQIRACAREALDAEAESLR